METPTVYTPAMGVSWSEVDHLYGVPVSQYRVQWSTNGVGSWTQLETELTLPELFDISIQSGQTRYYRVQGGERGGSARPVVAAGPGPHQGAEDVPEPPVNVSAAADGDSAIDVSWDAPLDDGGAPITRYEVQWSPFVTDGSWRGTGSASDGALSPSRSPA